MFTINTKAAFFTLQRAARHVADNGRIIYIGSSTTEHPVPGCGLYGGSKMAPRYLVEVLAQEVGHRGVAVNSIIPTTIDNAGVFTGGADQRTREWVASFRPMNAWEPSKTWQTPRNISSAIFPPFVSGQHLLLSGGAHI